MDAFGPGDIGAVAKLKETKAGDWLSAKPVEVSMPAIKLPAPVMAFAVAPKSKGDEEKVFTALRRLQEEDPTIDLHRDPQTGDHIVAGLSQVHVEVIVGRMKARFGAEVELKPPRVPYQEGIRSRPRRTGATRSRPAAAASSATATSRSSRWPTATDFEFENEIKGGVIPDAVHPRGGEGRARGDGPRDGGRLSR